MNLTKLTAFYDGHKQGAIEEYPDLHFIDSFLDHLADEYVKNKLPELEQLRLAYQYGFIEGWLSKWKSWALKPDIDAYNAKVDANDVPRTPREIPGIFGVYESDHKNEE